MSRWSKKILSEYITTKAKIAFQDFSHEVATLQTTYGIEKIRTLDEFAGHVWQRKNGDVVERTRDLVDTGELRDSLVTSFPDALTAKLTWDCDHAGSVFFGSISPGGYPVPPRNWVAWAHQDIGYENGYRDLFMKHWKRL